MFINDLCTCIGPAYLIYLLYLVDEWSRRMGALHKNLQRRWNNHCASVFPSFLPWNVPAHNNIKILFTSCKSNVCKIMYIHALVHRVFNILLYLVTQWWMIKKKVSTPKNVGKEGKIYIVPVLFHLFTHVIHPHTIT